MFGKASFWIALLGSLGVSAIAAAQSNDGQVVDDQVFYALLESEEETLSVELKRAIVMREQGRCAERAEIIGSALKSIATLARKRSGPGGLSAYDAEQLEARFLAEQALSCRPIETGQGEAVATIRDDVNGANGPDVQASLAELDAIAKVCMAKPGNAATQHARYDRFYNQVEDEIAGYERLLRSTTDPATRLLYADRMVVLGVRLAALPKPADLGCKADDTLAREAGTIASDLYSDPFWGSWQVKVDRVRGNSTQGRIAVWPKVDLQCEGSEGGSCIYRWAIVPGGAYEVEGSATHQPYGHNGIFQVVHGGETASVTHSYYPNAEVPEQLILSQGSMTGVWRYNGELAGRSTWQRQQSRITQIGLSDITGEFKPSENKRYGAGDPMAVSGSYDAYDWSAANSARIRRPKLLVNLYGENMDGAHFVEFPRDRGFAPEMSRPIYSDDAKRRVIGASVLVTLMPDATPGRKDMIVDGQEYVLDIAISGYPERSAN